MIPKSKNKRAAQKLPMPVQPMSTPTPPGLTGNTPQVTGARPVAMAPGRGTVNVENQLPPDAFHQR